MGREAFDLGRAFMLTIYDVIKSYRYLFLDYAPPAVAKAGPRIYFGKFDRFCHLRG